MARLLAACNSVSYLLFSLFGIPFVEKGGRRKMLMFAAAGQFFCYFMITTLLGLSADGGYSIESANKLATASVAFFFLYYVFFGIGFQGVPWLVSLCVSLTYHFSSIPFSSICPYVA